MFCQEALGSWHCPGYVFLLHPFALDHLILGSFKTQTAYIVKLKKNTGKESAYLTI
jgi:hypothetical protein